MEKQQICDVVLSRMWTGIHISLLILLGSIFLYGLSCIYENVFDGMQDVPKDKDKTFFYVFGNVMLPVAVLAYFVMPPLGDFFNKWTHAQHEEGTRGGQP